MLLTEPLVNDLWSLTFTCHHEAGAAYQKTPFGVFFGGGGCRTQAFDRAEANWFDRESREPLALILTLKHAHTQGHTPLICRQTHLNTWHRWLRACLLFISSPAVCLSHILLFLFIFLTNSLWGMCEYHPRQGEIASVFKLSLNRVHNWLMSAQALLHTLTDRNVLCFGVND